MNQPELREARVLLVDDDPSAIHAMRHLLSDFPHLRFASTGEDALRIARANRPDLVVVDAQLPGMTGLEVCRAMRGDPTLASVPLIMATSTNHNEVELAAREHGVADFIAKPLLPETFRARVRARLRDHARLGAHAGALVPPGPQVSRDLPSLLIVDDDAAAVQMLGSTLQDVGSIHFVTDGRAALDMARQLEPDLVLLDASMPGVDGFSVCQALKEHPRLRSVPVVFVTRYDTPSEETRALELGAADFVSKPYVAPVLRARVRNLLELKRRVDAELRAASDRWRRIADARVTELVRTASDAILVCDEQQTVQLANAAASSLFDVPVDQLVGSPLSNWLESPDVLATQAGATAVPLRVQRRDASPRLVEASVSMLEEHGSRLSSWVLRDVSDRERLQAERTARAAAEASSEAKTRMIGVIAHELNNPLTAVLGYAQLLQLDRSTPSPQRHAPWVENIRTAAEQMRRLIDDLVEFARHESGRLQIEIGVVDVRGAIMAALAAIEPAARAAHIALQAPPEVDLPEAAADPMRLHQCLTNLVSNAVKYNDAGGSVRFELGTTDDGCVRVAVLDDGMGMDETQLATLFQPFNRLGRERSDRPGTGLGLVITRQLIHAMHGELSVSSVAGQGSRFEITLPAAAEPDCGHVPGSESRNDDTAAEGAAA